MHPQAIVFDAVGTLIFPEPAAGVVYLEVGRRFGSRLGLDEVASRFREAFAREEAVDLAAGLRTSEAREVERWRRIVLVVLDDVRDPERCFQALYEHFAKPSAWRCHPEAGVVLKTLGERGCRLAMASNYDHRLRTVVAGLPELQPLAGSLAISSEITWRKPAREFFDAVADMLVASGGRQSPENDTSAAVHHSQGTDVPRSPILFIGDDLANDYEGARAAGMRALLFDPQRRSSLGPGERIERLAEVLDFEL
jgi:putative hydrolase of the HAD superfamily